MNRLRMLTLGLITVGTAAAVLRKMADERARAPGRFVDDALAHGTAELESAKLALEKSSAVEVKAFAYEMIDDHTLMNQHLRQLARNKGHHMDDDATLVSGVQDMLLRLREAENFDRAYARSQVAAHRRIVQMLSKATDMDDFEVSSFARKSLPKMEHHLKMAQDMYKQISTGGPLKAATGGNTDTADKGAADEGVWPLARKNAEVREPQQGDTPSGPREDGITSADNTGGTTTRTPAAGEVSQERNPAKPASSPKDSLAEGTPQETRGNPQNPGH